jgi:hypothetical protein
MSANAVVPQAMATMPTTVLFRQLIVRTAGLSRSRSMTHATAAIVPPGSSSELSKTKRASLGRV